MNIKKRLDELGEATYKVYTASEKERNAYKNEIDMLKTIIEWIDLQVKSISEGSYDSETKRLRFKMKNTTPYFISKIDFPLIVSEKKTIPIEIYNWAQNEIKDVRFYYDYNNDRNYQTSKTIKLATDAEKINLFLFDEKANENTGNEGEEQRRCPTGYSEKQGYVVFFESFINNIYEIDLRAKARMMLELLITVFDIVQKDRSLENQTNRLMNIYLPTIRRTMHHYMEAVASNSTGQSVDELRTNVHKTLNVEIRAVKTLIEKLHSQSKEESYVDLDVMKKFMQEDGLI